MVKIKDFDASFLTFAVKGHANYGRFKVESVCKITTEECEDEYYTLSPVMACNVYGKGQLIKEPAYLFQAIFSKTEFKIFRTYAGSIKTDDSSGRIESGFEGIEVEIREEEGVLLDNETDIITFAGKNGKILGRISLEDRVGKDAIGTEIDFPVRHINIKPQTGEFQVETGTIALPDFSADAAYKIDRFNIAHIAFNSLDRMDVIRMPLSKVERKTCRIKLYGVN